MYNQSENEDGQLSIFAEGGSTSEGIDLFEDYENIPSKVQKVLDKYEDAFMDGSYSGLAQALKAVEKIGYTFEYYLDGAAYDLRPIGKKGKTEVMLEEEEKLTGEKEGERRAGMDDEYFANGGYMAKGGMINYVFDIYSFGEDEDIDRKSKKVFKVKASNRSKAYEKAKNKYPNDFVELADSYAEDKMANAGMMAKGGMMDLKYPKFKAEEPEFTPEKEFKSPYSTFKSEAYWTVGGFNFFEGKDKGKKDAYDWYNQIKDIDNQSDFQELSIKKEKEISSKNSGYIQYQVPEYVPSKVGQVFHFSSFKKAKKGEEFKFTYMNGGIKREIEFVFDKIVLEKVLGWLKIDGEWNYGVYIYDDRENNACFGSGGAKLTLVSRKYADGSYMAEGGETENEELYKVVGKKNGQLVEISELPMTKEDAKKFVIEQGIERNYNNVDIIRYRGNKPRHKMADGGETENENFEMLESLIVQIKHHAKELEDVDNVEIEAWVLSKAQRAATDLSDITHYLDGKKAEETMESGGYMAKGGSISSIERRVEEVNAMIKEANDKGLQVIDESGTWQSPMKYKPLKYSNGVLYAEYQELNLYKNNRGEGNAWETKKDKITKRDEDYGYSDNMDGYAQKKFLSDIARMYRKVLNEHNKYGYADGGYMAKGGIVVTSIKDIPNFKKILDEGKITYRGLGLGKLWDDFNKLTGTTGKKIKVAGKEYFITDEEFNTFSRGADGKLRIRFEAPFRKSYEDGGYMEEIKQKLIKAGYSESDAEDLADEYKQGGSKVPQKVKDILASKNKMSDGGYMAKGGGVEDKFKGKNSKEVWNNLDSSTRAKVLEYLFLKEKSGNQYYDSYNSLNELSYSEWDKLPKNIKKEIENFDNGGSMAKGGEVKNRINEVKKDAQHISKINNTKTYVFDYEFDRNTKTPNRLSERITFGTQEDFDYMAEKGFDKYQKVIAIFNNGIEQDKMNMGGKVTFDDKVSSIKKSLLKKKTVSPKVQKDYGKTYNKKEALESAQRIAGAMKAKYRK